MNFQEVRPNPESISPEAFQRRFNVSVLEATCMAEQAQRERMFINDTYQVTMSQVHPTHAPGWPAMIHLSVIRRDQEPIREWADMQAIKNVLIGPEHEAIEIYPAESRLVDCGNNYHLWVFAEPTFRIPMGWQQRMVQK